VQLARLLDVGRAFLRQRTKTGPGVAIATATFTENGESASLAKTLDQSATRICRIVLKTGATETGSGSTKGHYYGAVGLNTGGR